MVQYSMRSGDIQRHNPCEVLSQMVPSLPAMASPRPGNPFARVATIRAGRPKIAGTGVTVMRVAAWYKMGMSPEEIATQYGHLSLAQVHAALAYYHANPEEIEADLADEEAFAEKVEREAACEPAR